MKGVILAGGLGRRLDPLTRVTNKHLLPVYNKPMIHYPIQTLVSAGVRDILIVTGGNSAGDFLKLLGDGGEFGLTHLNYAYQRGEGGIAEALRLAKDFVDGSKFTVVLGDNILRGSIENQVAIFNRQVAGARILLKEVRRPERFGVAALDGEKLVGIVEKPEVAPSPYAVIGVYMYDASVFDVIKTLKPSARGELEITDVNNHYLRGGTLSYGFFDGWWSDAGTFNSLLKAGMYLFSELNPQSKT